MNIRIRLLGDDEAQSVNEVYNNSYGNIRPISNFRWEFEQGPLGKAIYVIAEDLDKSGNKIIGTQAAIPLNFVNGAGEKVLTAKSEDTFVHPEYRGHKLFDKMYELLFEECRKSGIQFIWGFTYARKPFLKLGFEIPFETLQGLYVINPLKTFYYLSKLNPNNRISDKIKIFGLSILGYLKTQFQFNNANKNSILTATTDIPSKTNISQFNCYDKKWTLDQDEKYKEWRFNFNPFENKYKFHSFKLRPDNNLNDAEIITNHRPEGFAYIEQIKFGSLPNTTSKLFAIKYSIKYLKKESKKPFLIRFWGFNNNEIGQDEISVLKKTGFVFVNKGTAFVWKSLSKERCKIESKDVILSRAFTQGNK